ncbi:TIGR03032 family protein [Dapis sp. BLCC M172]|uniref:TIGR03032 family protein n=1 Tax=Dapis sp. BLCC M172 TaxID=2975281 RepID=UPI003CF6E84E
MKKLPPITKTLKVTYSLHFLEWLNKHQLSLAFTSQTNCLCFIGVKPDGQMSTPVWQFDRPRKLYAKSDRLYLSTQYQIWRFENILENDKLLKDEYDRFYVPRVAYTTGDLDIHDLVEDDKGDIIFINTQYSCLATLHSKHSFTPLWKPSFISQVAPEDRCHLNGLATVEGQPRYVTAISRSDVALGWQSVRRDGGVVIKINTNEIIADGLSMPRSPRWYRGKLWLLNSGTGDFGYIENGRFLPITFCPGYGKSLTFIGDFAVVGLSKLSHDYFSDLLVEERLKKRNTDIRCGIVIIDLKSGNIVEWLQLEPEIIELYDVAVLPGVNCSTALGFQAGDMAKLVTIGSQPKVNNLSVSSSKVKPKRKYFLLPLPVWLFLAFDWEQQERLIAAIALIYIISNKPVEQPSFSFISNPKISKNNPQKAKAYFEQGKNLKKQGKYAEAAIYFKKAIEADNTYVPAHNNLGVLRQNQGLLKEAIICYENVLKIKPNFHPTITNIASIHLCQGELKKAEEGLRRALKIKPDYVHALYHLGLVYKQQIKLEDAIKLFKLAVKYQPNYIDAYFQLGQIWEFQSQFSLAKIAYERCQKINPTAEYLFGHISFVKLNLCDWENYDDFVTQLIDSTAKYVKKKKGGFTIAPFHLNLIPLPQELSLAVAIQKAESINHQVVNNKLQFSYPQKTSKLRIGYVSCDFYGHAVGRLISGIFEQHNRDKFEVFAYHLLNANDEVTQTIKNGCDEFRYLDEMSAENSARQINRDGIDILIDLAGYTGYSETKILAYKPAPVQATFLGYPNTMGANFIRYLLTDKWVVPPELAEHYSEEIIYLPHQFPCSPMDISQKDFSRTDFGLPEEGFVFACFNRHYKITPQLFDIWMRILQQVEGSILWLSFTVEEAIENLRQSAKNRGVKPERLIFAQKIPHPEYLARLSLANLALDTLIYNGGSTNVCALYAGLPVLTKPGSTNAARMGASICASAGIEEMICHSLEEYEQKAVFMGTHPEELLPLRQKLKMRNSPLFNLSDFVASLEVALEEIWNR